jgi:endonuclease-3 related protein
MKKRLIQIYDTLYRFFGPQYWWPAETPFEVIIGAILTQNTNWTNVEKAIDNLRNAKALDIKTLNGLPQNDLELLIRPSGFFRQKAVRLQNFTQLLNDEFHGGLNDLFALSDNQLRTTLLARPGIGPETADSIMLYAAGRPSFVVDAYTHRILDRIGIQSNNTEYEKTRTLFMTSLPRETDLFNEFHALIVRLAKEFCRKRSPVCNSCPLLSLCNFGQSTVKD